MSRQQEACTIMRGSIICEGCSQVSAIESLQMAESQADESPYLLNTGRKNRVNPSFERIVAYIDQNYMHQLTLEDVARHVYHHQAYVSQLFAKELGIGFSTYLERVRLNKAKVLLLTTNMSVVAIAKDVGYASPSYFSKVFKKRVGITPRQYRDAVADNHIFNSK